MKAVPLLEELKGMAKELSPRSSLPEAARILICLQAREVDANLPGALAGLGPAPVHDARVAGRRLRAGAELFRPLYPGVWEGAASRARRVARGLRLARDLDIRCARLGRLMRRRGGGAGRRAALGRLLDESLSERQARKALPPPGRLSEGLLAPVLPLLWAPRSALGGRAERFARVRLGELARETALRIPTASLEPLGGIQHRLRIRGKALRYSLEMMEWRLGGEARWRIGVLQKVQDVLGEIHDIDVLSGFIAGRTKGSVRRESECSRELAGALGEERHLHFGRFLDLRWELERACSPPTVI